MDYETFDKKLLWQGRNAGPMLLQEHWQELSAEDKKKALLEVWVMAEWPARALPWQIWTYYFKQTGFLCDDPNIKKPQQPLTIYRGAVKHKRKGMSWTQDRELAAWFAKRFEELHKGYLYKTTIEPEYILAIVTGGNGRPGETEVIVNPECLINIKRLEL